MMIKYTQGHVTEDGVGSSGLSVATLYIICQITQWGYNNDIHVTKL